MDKPKLNENDNRLLAFCKTRKHSVSEISKGLNLSGAAISVRINKLNDMDLLVVDDREKTGKKTMVRTKEGISSKKHQVEILKKLKEKKQVTLKEYDNLLEYNPDPFNDPEGYDKTNALFILLYSGLVVQKVEITEEGIKFLKQNKK